MNIDLKNIYERMPDFSGHEDAREWFKEQFGEQFLLKSCDEREGKKVYLYHLVKDQDMYQQYMESFAHPVKHEITHIETFESYSTIEVSEDGDINFTL